MWVKITNKVKSRLQYVVIISILTVIMSVSTYADVQNASVDKQTTGSFTETTAGSDSTEGGNVTRLDLKMNASTSKWQGYFGNISSIFGLGVGGTLFYNLSSAGVSAVYASQNASFDFASIETGAAVDIDTVWGYTASDSDSAQTIYTGLTDIEAVVDAPSVELEPLGNDWNSTILDSGSTNDKSYFAFGINPQMATNTCFDGSDCQFQLLVPADGQAGELYYFFMSV